MSTLIFSLWTMFLAIACLASLPGNGGELTVVVLQFIVLWPLGLALLDWAWRFIERYFL